MTPVSALLAVFVLAVACLGGAFINSRYDEGDSPDRTAVTVVFFCMGCAGIVVVALRLFLVTLGKSL